VKNGEKSLANPFVVLREEFDDWAVLFDPDTCRGFGLSPTGVYVWKLLDGEHGLDELIEKLRRHAEDMPGDAREHIGLFVDALVANGLAVYGHTGSYREKPPHAPCGPLNEVGPFTYEPPQLINLSGGQAANGHVSCATHGSQSSGNCASGGSAGQACCGGSCGTPPSCCSGTCDTASCGSGGNPQDYPCGWGSTNPVMCNCYSYGANATSCQYGTNAGTCSTGNSK
jgi:SynChlorMet cassette protein ScmD